MVKPPELSYEEAMKWCMPREDGSPQMDEIYSIHASRFRSLLYRAIQDSPHGEALRVDIGQLLLRYRSDRWYAMTLLVKAGIALPGRPGRSRVAQSAEKE